MTILHVLDVAEWDAVLAKMNRYHQVSCCAISHSLTPNPYLVLGQNITNEIRDLIAQIRREMKQELVPMAQDKATYGKVVKQAIRSMWALEYEIVDVQEAFSKSIGNIDLDNLTDDFIEEVLMQSKPQQAVLHAIRVKQKNRMEEVKKEYWEKISELEPMPLERPPKPEPKPEEPLKPAEDKPKEGEKKPEDAAKPAEAPAAEAPAEAPKEGEQAAPPAEPAPAAVEQPPAVEASA